VLSRPHSLNFLYPMPPKSATRHGSRSRVRGRGSAGRQVQSSYPTIRSPWPFTAQREDMMKALMVPETRPVHMQDPAILATGTGEGGLADQLDRHFAISRHSDANPSFEPFD